MLIPYLWTKSGIMVQQTNINLIDFSFLRFFMKIFLEIGISILEVANASSATLTCFIFIFYLIRKCQIS